MHEISSTNKHHTSPTRPSTHTLTHSPAPALGCSVGPGDAADKEGLWQSCWGHGREGSELEEHHLRISSSASGARISLSLLMPLGMASSPLWHYPMSACVTDPGLVQNPRQQLVLALTQTLRWNRCFGEWERESHCVCAFGPHLVQCVCEERAEEVKKWILRALIDPGGEMTLDESVEVWMLGCCCDLAFWLLSSSAHNCFRGCVVTEANVALNLRCGLEPLAGLGFLVITGNGTSWTVCCQMSLTDDLRMELEPAFYSLDYGLIATMIMKSWWVVALAM